MTTLPEALLEQAYTADADHLAATIASLQASRPEPPRVTRSQQAAVSRWMRQRITPEFEAAVDAATAGVDPTLRRLAGELSAEDRAVVSDYLYAIVEAVGARSLAANAESICPDPPEFVRERYGARQFEAAAARPWAGRVSLQVFGYRIETATARASELAPRIDALLGDDAAPLTMAAASMINRLIVAEFEIALAARVPASDLPEMMMHVVTRQTMGIDHVLGIYPRDQLVPSVRAATWENGNGTAPA